MRIFIEATGSLVSNSLINSINASESNISSSIKSTSGFSLNSSYSVSLIIISTIFSKPKHLKAVCLVSGSNDGDLIAYPCESFMMEVL